MVTSGGNHRFGSTNTRWWRAKWRYVVGAAIATACILAGTIVAASASLEDGSSQPAGNYISLGDSFSSGEGNPAFEPGTTVNPPYLDLLNSTPGSCHRSVQSWTYKLQTSKYSREAQLACSNAKVAALTNSFKGEPAQLTALKSMPAPKLVTITMGGNDIGFPLVMATCASGISSACTIALGAAAAQIGGLATHLRTAYAAIHQAAPNANILVVGYPNVMSNNFSTFFHCPWMNNADAYLMQQVASLLDRTISSTVYSLPAGDKVQYVSTLNAFAGHELCTGDSWLNPVTLDNPQWVYSAHPNATGQNAMLSIVQGYVNSHF